MQRLILCMATLVVLVTAAACAAGPARIAELEALTDIEMGIPQQDVYVEGDDGMLYRVHQEDLTDAILDQQAYATAEYNAPDLFELSDNPRGPYAKGEPLEFTFGEFIDAAGHGQYIKHASGFDEILLEFENLRPNGVYTLWCVVMWPPPTLDAVELPCGAPDGSQAEFQADGEGNLEVHLKMSAMPYSTPDQISNLCLAYHSDGQTYGYTVGEYGKNAHIQLCFDVPAQDSDRWETTTLTGTSAFPSAWPSRSAAPVEAASSPDAVVQGLVDAWNAGDVDRVLAHFARDAVVTTRPAVVAPDSPRKGHAEIRAWIERNLADNAQIDLTVVSIDDGVVTATTRVTADGMAVLGVDAVTGEDQFMIEDGRIVAHTFTYSDESIAEVEAAMN